MDDINILYLKNILNETCEWRKINPKYLLLKPVFDYYISEDGRLYNASKHMYIAPDIDNRENKGKGYKRYVIVSYDSKGEIKRKKYPASKLVALHFLPHIKGKDKVLYKDGDRSNINKSNLYFGDIYDSLTKYNIDIDCNDRKLTKLHFTPLDTEKWKRLYIAGIDFDDDYMVSTYGRVYNNTKKFYTTQQNSSYKNHNGQSYKHVNLSVRNYKNHFRMFKVHTLVALTFCKNTYPDNIPLVVNHINGNPSCNLAINLEWCTQLENMKHAVTTNLLSIDEYTKQFERNIDDECRINTILAWSYIYAPHTDESAYKYYTMYRYNYENSLPGLTFNGFTQMFHDKYMNDDEFKRLFEFYKSSYYNN